MDLSQYHVRGHSRGGEGTQWEGEERITVAVGKAPSICKARFLVGSEKKHLVLTVSSMATSSAAKLPLPALTASFSETCLRPAFQIHFWPHPSLACLFLTLARLLFPASYQLFPAPEAVSHLTRRVISHNCFHHPSHCSLGIKSWA